MRNFLIRLDGKMLAPALAGIVLVGFHPAPAGRGGAAARGVEAAFVARRGGFPALDAGEPRRRPFLSQRIPEDQEPVVQLQVLSGAPFYDWAATDAYGDRIVGLYQGTMIFLSLPISLVTFNVLPAELPQLLLAANMGTCATATSQPRPSRPSRRLSAPARSCAPHAPPGALSFSPSSRV